jgi:HEAT repeat protein
LATALIYKLAREETAGHAVESLAAYGQGIEATLERVLDNPLEDAAIRRNVPRVLGKLGSSQSVVVLSAHLSDPDEGLRRNLYKALSRALRKRPGLTLDRKALLKALDYELSRGYHALACAQALGLSTGPTRATPRTGTAAAEALLFSALEEKVLQCQDRLFTLLSILYPDAEVELIYAGFRDASAQDAARRRANALELLENLLDRPMRHRIFPLLEDQPRENKLRAAAEHYPLGEADPETRLKELLTDESTWVRACALYLAGERGLATLQAPMLENLDHASPVVREACVAALEKVLPLPQLGAVVEKKANDESAPVRERARALLQAVRAVQTAG